MEMMMVLNTTQTTQLSSLPGTIAGSRQSSAGESSTLFASLFGSMLPQELDSSATPADALSVATAGAADRILQQSPVSESELSVLFSAVSDESEQQASASNTVLETGQSEAAAMVAMMMGQLQLAEENYELPSENTVGQTRTDRLLLTVTETPQGKLLMSAVPGKEQQQNVESFSSFSVQQSAAEQLALEADKGSLSGISAERSARALDKGKNAGIQNTQMLVQERIPESAYSANIPVLPAKAAVSSPSETAPTLSPVIKTLQASLLPGEGAQKSSAYESPVSTGDPAVSDQSRSKTDGPVLIQVKAPVQRLQVSTDALSLMVQSSEAIDPADDVRNSEELLAMVQERTGVSRVVQAEQVSAQSDSQAVAEKKIEAPSMLTRQGELDLNVLSETTGSGSTSGNQNSETGNSHGQQSFAHLHASALEPIASTNISSFESDGLPISKESLLDQVSSGITRQEQDGENKTIRLQLKPESLGNLQITLTMDDQKVKVDIVAENRMVKHTLLENLDTLKELLSRQQITVERFDVGTGANSFQGGLNREGRQPENQQQGRPQFHAGTGFVEHGHQQERSALWVPRKNALVDVRF